MISARIPDMDPRDDSFGYPASGQTLIMIISKSADIKNPTEQGQQRQVTPSCGRRRRPR